MPLPGALPYVNTFIPKAAALGEGSVKLPKAYRVIYREGQSVQQEAEKVPDYTRKGMGKR